VLFGNPVEGDDIIEKEVVGIVFNLPALAFSPFRGVLWKRVTVLLSRPVDDDRL
jgi:hypothetical protein